MGVRLSAWAWSQTGLKVIDKMVLLRMADAANDDGRGVWEAIETMAQKCETSASTIRRSLRRLEEAGLIMPEIRPGTTTRYFLKADPTPVNMTAHPSHNDCPVNLAPQSKRLPTPVTRDCPPQSTVTGEPEENQKNQKKAASGSKTPEAPQLSLVEDPEGAPSRKSPERPIPNNWRPTPRHLALCAEHAIDIDREASKFKGHALANDRRLRNWNQGFTNWLNNGIAKGWVEKLPPPPKPEREEPDFVPTLKLRRPQP